VLPSINTEQRLKLANDGVLVLVGVSNGSDSIPHPTYSICADANLPGLLVLDEPSPSTALDAGESSVHLGLELAETTVGGVNGLGQSAGGGLATASTLGGQVLPEEGVVKVTTAVEVDGGLESNLGSDVTLVLGLLELLNGVVVVGDIGVVVVLVVNLHDLAGDGGLQSAVVVFFVSSCRMLQKLPSHPLTGQVRKSGLATGKGQARSTGLGGSRSSRAKGNTGRVTKKSSHCEYV
jgi:hypothetical protein